MAGNVNLWSTTANTNQSVDPDINFAEGQLPGTLNDSCRGMMAGVAGNLKDTTAQVTTGGSGAAMTFASNIPGLTYLQGLEIVFKAGATNLGGGCTMNVTPSGGAALGAKAIRMMTPGGEIDPPAGAILLNGHYRIVYDTAASNAVGAFILQPQPQLAPGGRLTLTTGTPVLITNTTAQSTVYYTPYVGGAFSELSCVLDTSNFLSTKLYDFFLVQSATGSVALGYGPAWTNNTTRSGAISRFGGLWVNSGTMTIRLSSSTTVSAAANTAIYVGTCYGTANGQTGMNISAIAAGGGANILGVFNAYNRVFFLANSRDSTASWSYGTATWRAANNNTNNSISFVDGLGEVYMDAKEVITLAPSSGAFTAIGINLNSTSATPNVTSGQNTSAAVAMVALSALLPVQGYNTLTAMEWANSGSATFDGAAQAVGSGQSQMLQLGVVI